MIYQLGLELGLSWLPRLKYGVEIPKKREMGLIV
jgi:hypothetical protein